MPATERIRERISGTPGPDYFQLRMQSGWRLIAVEWERMADAEPVAQEEVPFGMRIAADCQHLEYDATEMAVLTLMMELILQEYSFARIAQALNEHGFRRRDDKPWTEISAFNLLPRLIEVGPRMFSTADWHERRQKVFKVLGVRTS